MIRTKAVLAVFLFVLAATPAKAALINGTLGFIPIGNTGSFTGASMSAATSVTFGTTEIVNNPGNATYNGQPNLFNGWAGSAVFQSPGALSLAGIGATLTPIAPVTDFFGFQNNRFQFDLSSLSKSMLGVDMVLAGAGVLRDTQGAFDATAAQFSFITSGGSNGQSMSNYSVSFSTAAPVPLPLALPLLASGLGVLGLGLRRR